MNMYICVYVYILIKLLCYIFITTIITHMLCYIVHCFCVRVYVCCTCMNTFDLI